MKKQYNHRGLRKSGEDTKRKEVQEIETTEEIERGNM